MVTFEVIFFRGRFVSGPFRQGDVLTGNPADAFSRSAVVSSLLLCRCLSVARLSSARRAPRGTVHSSAAQRSACQPRRVRALINAPFWLPLPAARNPIRCTIALSDFQFASSLIICVVLTVHVTSARSATKRFHTSDWRPLEACYRPWTW